MKKTISTILNVIENPKQWEDGGGIYQTNPTKIAINIASAIKPRVNGSSRSIKTIWSKRMTNLVQDKLLRYIKNGNTKALERILKQGIDIEDTYACGNYTLLVYACYIGNTEVIKLLLEYGANINAKSKYGFTPLSMSIFRENINTIKLLLERGANLNVTDGFGFTALFNAINSNNIEIVELLLEHGADVNVVDIDGWSVLMTAVKKDTSTGEIVKLLLAKGANVSFKNSDGLTALLVVLANRIPFTKDVYIRLLKQYGAK